MTIHRYIRCILVNFIIFALFMGPTINQEQDVYGAKKNNAQRMFFFEEDQELELPKNNVSFWFDVPENIEIKKDPILEVHVEFSPTFIEKLSSMTITINDEFVGTRRLDSKSKTSFIWKVKVDRDLIKKDISNEIKFTTVQRSIEGECADIDNPSNWLILKKESSMLLSSEQKTDPNLSDYHSLFFDSFNKSWEIKNDFILDDQDDIHEINAMLEVANATGMYYPDRKYTDYNVYLQEKQSKHNKIIIGKDSRGSSISINKEKDFSSLKISGSDQKQLRKATAFLSNEKLVQQTEAPTIALSSDIKFKNSKKILKQNEGGMYNFKDFGYKDINLAGVFHQRTDLSFVQPEGIKGGSESYIDIYFRHSDAIMSDRSQITVYINDVPMTSEKLTPSNKEGGNLTVDIPKSALDDPVIDVGIEVYHWLGKVDCDKDYYDVAWTLIDSEKSKISFEKGDKALKPSLKGFPFFHSEGNNDSLNVHLSKGNKFKELELSSLIAGRTGQNTRRMFMWNTKLSNTPKGDDDRKGESIYIVNKNDPDILNGIKGELPIDIEDGEYSVNDEKLSLIPEILEDKGIIQVINDEDDVFKKNYIIFTDGEQSSENLESLFCDREKLDTLDGQVALVGRGGKVSVFETSASSSSEEGIPLTFTDYLKKVESFIGMSWWMALILLVVALLIISFLIRTLRKKKDNYKEKEAEHREEHDFKER